MRHDSTAHCGKWLMISLLVLVAISHVYARLPVGGGLVGKENCTENEYWNEKGFCCDKCHPGFKLKQKCPEPHKRSQCEKCAEGTYQSKSNYFENCLKCEHCNPPRRPNGIVITNCTTTSNTVCGCKSGYFRKTLSSSTWQCDHCRECGTGQYKSGGCTEDTDTQCECQPEHYPVDSGRKCERCVECQKGCEFLCPTTTTINPRKTGKTQDSTETIPQIVVPICACVMVLAVGVFLLYEGIRLWKKKKRASSHQSSLPDPDSKLEIKPMIIAIPPDTDCESVPFTNQPCETQHCRELPDCVPREIKTHEFIYFVLDEVPVGRFKELVRRLGVSEQDIDRAERDHRTCKDAQYQMLKVWSDSGNRGGNIVLPRHLVQLLIDTLRLMCLAGCADNIESKFLSQDRALSSH